MIVNHLIQLILVSSLSGVMIIDSNMKGTSMTELDAHQEKQMATPLKAASKRSEESEPRISYTESLYPIPIEPSYEEESYHVLTGDMEHSPKLLPLENWGTEMKTIESEIPLEVEPIVSLEPTPTESRLHNAPNVLMIEQEEEIPEIRDTEIRDSDFYHPEYSRPYDYPVPTAYAPKVNIIPSMPEPTALPMGHPASGMITQGGNEEIEWENDSSVIPVGVYSEKCPIYVVTKTIVVTQEAPLPTGHSHTHNPYELLAHMPLYAANMHPKPSKSTSQSQTEEEEEKEEDENNDRIGSTADDKKATSQTPSQPIIVVVQNTPQGPSFIPMMQPTMMGSEEIEWSSIYSMDDSQPGSQSLSAASSPAQSTTQSQSQSIPLTQAQPSNPIWNIPSPPSNPFSNSNPSSPSLPSQSDTQSQSQPQPQLPSNEPSTNTITTSALSALYNAYLQTNQQIVENGFQMHQQQQQKDQVQQQQSQAATQQQQQSQLQGQQMESMLSMYQPLPAMQNRAADTISQPQSQPQPQPQSQSNPTGQLLVASGTDSISYPMWTPQMNQNPNYSTY